MYFTCNGYFCWPFRCPIQYTLLGSLCVLHKILFGDLEHFLNDFKHLWPISLPDFHSFFHGCDDGQSLILSTVLRALLCGPCNRKSMAVWPWRSPFVMVQKDMHKLPRLSLRSLDKFSVKHQENESLQWGQLVLISIIGNQMNFYHPYNHNTRINEFYRYLVCI